MEDNLEVKMDRTISNAEYIKQACYQYIKQIRMGIAGDYYRGKIHQLLLEHTHINDEKLRIILHNLDKHINYNEYEDISSLGNKLFEVLKNEMCRMIRDIISSDGDIMEFLRSRDMSPDEWVDMWSENMEFDGTQPVIRR